MESSVNDHILLEQHPDGIAVLTFNRPQARNALNLAAMGYFASRISKLAASDSLRCVILTGAGETAFCSGGDLVELNDYPTEADALNFITIMGDALLMLERLPVPVIAAINGYALGGGMEIAMACDLRIVDSAAKLGFVQIRLALTPGWGAGQRLLRQVGYAKAFEILLAGQTMTAEEFLKLGLVNRVVETGQALPQALILAKQIAAYPPDVVRSIKTLLQAGLTQSYESALQTERSLFPPLSAAEPHLKAMDTFVNRRVAGKRS
jgi:enoyl-CoA hydratase